MSIKIHVNLSYITYLSIIVCLISTGMSLKTEERFPGLFENKLYALCSELIQETLYSICKLEFESRTCSGVTRTLSIGNTVNSAQLERLETGKNVEFMREIDQLFNGFVDSWFCQILSME